MSLPAEVNLFVGTLASGVGISDFTIPLRFRPHRALLPDELKGYQVLQDLA